MASTYNYSINPRRFDFAAGVGVNVDLISSQKRACDLLQKMKGVMADPAPFTIVKEPGHYNVLDRFYG
jgi:hypothetical protein